jgi:hypothetical protein
MTNDLQVDERKAAALPVDHVRDFSEPDGYSLNVCEHCQRPFRGFHFRILCKVCQL